MTMTLKAESSRWSVSTRSSPESVGIRRSRRRQPGRSRRRSRRKASADEKSCTVCRAALSRRTRAVRTDWSSSMTYTGDDSSSAWGFIAKVSCTTRRRRGSRHLPYIIRASRSFEIRPKYDQSPMDALNQSPGRVDATFCGTRADSRRKVNRMDAGRAAAKVRC